MEDNNKYFSEIEKFEIINMNDGDKYNLLGNNDIIIDESGNLKAIMLYNNRGKFTLFGGNKEQGVEISWEYVKKIGTRTVIIDVEDDKLK